MKPLQKLLDIERLSYEARMDIALVLAIIPHLFLQKLPMLIFVFITLIFIVTNRNTPRHQHIATLLGLIAFIVSFFDNYNFSELTRMLFFVSVVNALLLYAIMLQRLKGEYNRYLKLSPALLMMLVFFYYTSITMLIYSIFVLFIFTLLAIWEKMEAKLSSLIRTTTMLFMLSLPVVIVLFIVFPRISFKKAEFGFKADIEMRTGHDGKMYLDSNALLVPSKRIIMEVIFPQDKIPADNQLYFRGSALYIDQGTSWQPLKKLENTRNPYITYSNPINYTILLHPHNKKWLYTLDVPLKVLVTSAKRNYDLIAINEEKIDELFRYEVTSALSFRHSIAKGYPNEALDINSSKNPKTAQMIQALRNRNISDAQKAQALMDLFSQQNLAYSINPKPLDLNHSIDSFLFEQKEGYCVHFASAFANSARMVGIPSRVITGYKASRKNMVENYLIIKENDAHAWVELYLKDRGWVRFEPTSTASKVLSTVDNIDGSPSQNQPNSLFKQINMQYMYLKYLINNWILDYNRSKQKELWQEILKNTILLIKILSVIALITLISLAIFLMLQRQKCEDRALCAMIPLLKKLQKQGFNKASYETMQEFLNRVQKSSTVAHIDEISTLYHRIKYSQYQESIKLLEDKIRAAIISIKKEKP